MELNGNIIFYFLYYNQILVGEVWVTFPKSQDICTRTDTLK